MKNKLLMTFSVLLLFVINLTMIGCKRTPSHPEPLKENPKVKDSVFIKENPSQANSLKVFVESSSSMDAYVNGNTRFKTALHCIIGQVITDGLKSEQDLKYYYIDSTIRPQNGDYRNFVKNLSEASFKKGTDQKGRAVSNIVDMIYQVVDSTLADGVTMFVSDCVYSPEPSADIDKALEKQRTDVCNKLKNKNKDFNDFGVLLYRLVSDFHGDYYTKTDNEIPINGGDRPYFVWFFGKKSILMNIHQSLSNIMSEQKAKSAIVGIIPQYDHVPHLALRTTGGFCHYKDEKTNYEGNFLFTFLADLSKLPFGADYLKDIKNYDCKNSKRCSINKIECAKDPKYPNYNYKISVKVKGLKNELVSPQCVEISLRNTLANVPDWVDEYDDPKGDDYDNGYDSTKMRTFGIKSLVDGVADYYNVSKVVTFKININK